jgi:hypothetical protein
MFANVLNKLLKINRFIQCEHISLLNGNEGQTSSLDSKIFETNYSNYERLFNIFYIDFITNYLLGYGRGFQNLYYIKGNILNGFVNIYLIDGQGSNLYSRHQIFFENIEGL